MLRSARRENLGKGARPIRPRELQDPLNFYLYHPLSWRLALRLAHTPLTPNMVSVIGACFVLAAAAAYAQPWWPFSAVLGMALHLAWHVFDGADGDLARMTGRSSPRGEAIDGLCDHASHVVLYVTLAALLDRQIGTVAWLVTAIAGASHAIQTNHVEVQRRQYQWWVYGVPWLRTTSKDGDVADRPRRGLGALVAVYLGVAARMTPHALAVDARLAAAGQHSASELQRVRTIIRGEMMPLLGLGKLLGPNSRAIVLGLSMLASSPIYYFFYESVVLNLLLAISVARHNRAAARIPKLIEEMR